MNCSDLIKGLSTFSENIENYAKKNLKDFSVFQESKNLNREKNEKKEIVEADSAIVMRNFERFLLKLQRKQAKNDFLLSTVMSQRIYKIVNETNFKNDQYWIYNMVHDLYVLNKENLEKILLRSLEDEQKFMGKSELFQFFCSFFLIFNEESPNFISESLNMILNKIFNIVEKCLKNKPAVYKQLLVFLKELKILLFNENLSHCLSTCFWLKEQNVESLIKMKNSNCFLKREAPQNIENIEELSENCLKIFDEEVKKFFSLLSIQVDILIYQKDLDVLQLNLLDFHFFLN